MMTTGESWVSEMRSLALAKLLLTERDDLEIIQEPAGVGFDFLVRVHKHTAGFTPEFAVAVKGTRHAITSNLLIAWLADVHVPTSLTELPACLFAFQTDERRGSYCWISEPDITEDEPMLRSVVAIPTVPQLAPLDIQALDSIVAKVVAWDSAREKTLHRHARAS